ncbi:metallophosphoesterase family protein [Streptococcus himalayensis]|uniref:Serine/threonine protein phosphatase n=1 Tax=Streptococcus himalayensis TaxID=1888195 RepID=A0A917ABZ3_9STRE|nr:metallophosphoesterase family protein [Streptococcus himalayensis]GGE37585.1 serine/threonine protein phosphatase [Streptococcus himalayensis]
MGRLRRIALLSDIHGNQTALEAVLADTRAIGVTDYWVLGDSVMPGSGRKELLDLLASLPISLEVRGNWEDSLWRAAHGLLHIERPSHLYLMRLCAYVMEEISLEEIDGRHLLPMQEIRSIQGLEIVVSHHLPEKNWGRELIHIGAQEEFDKLFQGNQASIAIYGHIHQQLLRYGSQGQMIINPGSIGQPFFMDDHLRKDLRAQYAVLEIDNQGLANVDFRRVAYDVELELHRAKLQELPYFEIYRESLVNGIHHTHNHEWLAEIAQRERYEEEVQQFFKSR